MANLQDLRRRVRSVRNMQKITKAMKMVAAARLRRAQDRVVNIVGEYINVTARTVDHEDAAAIARDLMTMFTAEASTIDRVFLIYNEFKSVLSQRVTTRQLLPIGADALNAETGSETRQKGEGEVSIDYLYEQPPAQIFGELLPRYVETQLFYALLESIASEHGARMTAMDSASKNAGEVIETLTLNMNRVRQASITREIIEVVSGARALEG